MRVMESILKGWLWLLLLFLLPVESTEAPTTVPAVLLELNDVDRNIFFVDKECHLYIRGGTISGGMEAEYRRELKHRKYSEEEERADVLTLVAEYVCERWKRTRAETAEVVLQYSVAAMKKQLDEQVMKIAMLEVSKKSTEVRIPKSDESANPDSPLMIENEAEWEPVRVGGWEMEEEKKDRDSIATGLPPNWNEMMEELKSELIALREEVSGWSKKSSETNWLMTAASEGRGEDTNENFLPNLDVQRSEEATVNPFADFLAKKKAKPSFADLLAQREKERQVNPFADSIAVEEGSTEPPRESKMGPELLSMDLKDVTNGMAELKRELSALRSEAKGWSRVREISSMDSVKSDLFSLKSELRRLVKNASEMYTLSTVILVFIGGFVTAFIMTCALWAKLDETTTSANRRAPLLPPPPPPPYPQPPIDNGPQSVNVHHCG